MKKGINKNVFACIVLLALLALLAVYFLGYKKYAGLAETTRQTNEVLQGEVDALKVYYINKAQYEADMIPMKEEIHAIMGKYPSDTRVEDVIMHSVYTQFDAPVSYSSINIGAKEIFKSISQEEVLATAQEDMQEGINFVKLKGTYIHRVESYDGLKQLIQKIFDSEYNLGIERLSYSKAGEGALGGTMELLFYSMDGNGKEYVKPDMTPYLQGTGNIFGYITVLVDEDGNIIGAPVETENEDGVSAIVQ